MGETGCAIWGKWGLSSCTKKEEFISDIWGKRGATYGEKGCVSANDLRQRVGVGEPVGAELAHELDRAARVGERPCRHHHRLDAASCRPWRRGKHENHKNDVWEEWGGVFFFWHVGKKGSVSEREEARWR